MDKPDFLNILDIVGQYVQLTPEGKSHYLGTCPFCSAADSLILSVDTQFWHCLSCGVSGDRYDFVARSENIGRAQAILTVAHHTTTGEPFPHARFKATAPSAKPTETPAPARTAAAAAAPPSTKQPEPPKTQAAPGPPPAQKGGAGQAPSAPFLEFRNLITSYQGAALLDDKARVTLADTEYPRSADLAAIGGVLAPILEQAGIVYSQSNSTLPATLTLESEDSALLVHKFGTLAKSRLLVVRLANPSDLPVARRLVASASAKLT